MNSWSNIVIPSEDAEINKISRFEAKPGKVTESVNKIRELITWFEVCHFKYQKHLERIKANIIKLNPDIDIVKIAI